MISGAVAVAVAVAGPRPRGTRPPTTVSNYDPAPRSWDRFATEERLPTACPCAIFHRDAHGKGDMAKKTSKKTPRSASARPAPGPLAPPNEDDDARRLEALERVTALELAMRRAELGQSLGDAEKKTAAQRAEIAAARCVRWLHLYVRLDEIQVDAGKHIRSVFTDVEDLDAPLRRRVADRFRFIDDAIALFERVPALGPGAVDDADRKDVLQLVSLLMGGARVHGVRADPGRLASDIVAGAMRVARIAAEVDGKLARGFEPMPDPFALDVLRRLARQPGRTAKEIAIEIAGIQKHQRDERKVERAIDRLRKLGFELFNPSRGGGYLPTDADLARLERIDAPGRGT